MNARVVVADDDPDIRRLIVLTLQREGCIVLEASDGTAALELIQTELPDAAVLDIMMPGLSGTEVTRLLAADAQTQQIPVVLLSALANATDVEAGIATGARAYLTKPFVPRQLATRVAALVEEARETLRATNSE